MNAIKPMRPLAPFYRPDERFEISADGLAEWRRSDVFQRLLAFYRSYPLQSLISDDSRALLHHLVMMHRPRRVLAGDAEHHPFRPDLIDWHDYWLNIHMPGLRRHIYPQLDIHTRGRFKALPRYRNLVDLLDRAADR